LTDTFATETFLKDFTEDLAQKCSGVRQDSGDPIAFVPRIVRHYKEHNVDPRTKTIVFSDSLDVERCLELKNWAVRHGIGSSFGVGTFLTSILPVSLSSFLACPIYHNFSHVLPFCSCSSFYRCNSTSLPYSLLVPASIVTPMTSLPAPIFDFCRILSDSD
jgi:Nicotinate phosphoribosyltransferase (NAPRTase) family